MAVNVDRPVNRPAVHELDRLWIARLLADWLDQRFTIPGTSIRIGLDPLISLIPGIGDLIANLTGSLILVIGFQLGVPKITLVRMAINVATNSILGALPIVGDIISIWYRSNIRNVELLDRHLAGQSEAATASDWLMVIGLVVGLVLILGGLLVFTVWLLKQIWNLV